MSNLSSVFLWQTQRKCSGTTAQLLWLFHVSAGQCRQVLIQPSAHEAAAQHVLSRFCSLVICVLCLRVLQIKSFCVIQAVRTAGLDLQIHICKDFLSSGNWNTVQLQWAAELHCFVISNPTHMMLSAGGNWHEKAKKKREKKNLK